MTHKTAMTTVIPPIPYATTTSKAGGFMTICSGIVIRLGLGLDNLDNLSLAISQRIFQQSAATVG